MRLNRFSIPILAIVGLVMLLAACAQMKSISTAPDSHPEALATGQQLNCTECHEDQQKGTIKSYSNFSHTPNFVKNHRFYAASNDRLCSSCHKPSFCNDCHSNRTEIKPSALYGNRPDREMPHRGNFMTLHKIEGKLDPASCYRCHGRANSERCSPCHNKK